MSKILITGGSGFIGTNAVEYFAKAGHEVLNIDVKPPQDIKQKDFHIKVDILDIDTLKVAFAEFAPEYLIHLAARADLHETLDLSGYDSNIQGVRNIVQAIAEQPSVKRSIFTSTKLVCPTDHQPKSMEDYCPNTLYGESKVEGEKIVKNDTTMSCEWCIVRPTSIWGPWSIMPHIPYGKFFQMIASGKYFHPGKIDPPKSFGYVGNFCFQLDKLLQVSADQVHRQIFYLSDYEVFTITSWANSIAEELNKGKIRQLPEPIVQLLAFAGDVLKKLGVKEPPFSSFRLKNMRCDTAGIPLQATRDITGDLPMGLDQGTKRTISWLRDQNLI